MTGTTADPGRRGLRWLTPARPLRLDRALAPAEAVAFTTLIDEARLGIDAGAGIETYRVLRRMAGQPWSRVRLEDDRLTANFQGDPRWPADVLRHHPRLAGHFGLAGSFDAQRCIVPTPQTINRGLRALHEAGGGARRFGFRAVADYARDGAGRIPDTAYVDAFIDDGVLPFDEPERRDSVHDWSYHFVTMLFPQFLSQLRANLVIVRDLCARADGAAPTRYGWNYFGHTLDAAGRLATRIVHETLSRRDALYRQMAIGLDSSCAKLVQLMKVQLDGGGAHIVGAARLANAFFHPPSTLSLGQILIFEPLDDLLPAAQGPEPPASSLAALVAARLQTLEAIASRLATPQAGARRAAALAACLAQGGDPCADRERQ